MNVWMIDIDSEELSLAQKLVKSNVNTPSSSQMIVAEVLDVSDAKSLQLLAEQVLSKGTCHILFNNAAVGLGGGALDTDLDTLHKVMNINTFGPIYGCQAFIPGMKTSNEPGIIINTGSKQGITMPPGNLAYNLSKAALKTYTEGLEHELMKKRVEGNGKLRAVLLIPGWTNTSIMLKAERQKALDKGETYKDEDCFFYEDKPNAGAWMPQQVLDYMIEQVDQHDSFYVLCPDNEVDTETDKLRITWTAQDITENRPPLSRWHPDYKEKFAAYMEEAKKK